MKEVAFTSSSNIFRLLSLQFGIITFQILKQVESLCQNQNEIASGLYVLSFVCVCYVAYQYV